MKKLMLTASLMLVILMTACQSMSLPTPTEEEAKAYEGALQEVLASAGFGGVVDAAKGEGGNGEYSAGDKIGLFTITSDSHIRVDVDLSGILKGEQSVSYDIDVTYRPLIGDEKSIVYVAETRPGSDGNVTVISKAELNGKAFDPAAMQSMLSD